MIEEISRGNEAAARLRLEKIAKFPMLEITDGVRRLADNYFGAVQIPEKARGDTYDSLDNSPNPRVEDMTKVPGYQKVHAVKGC